LYSPSGEFLAATPAVTDRAAADSAVRACILRTIEANRTIISAPYRVDGSPGAAIMLTAPVLAADGRLLAVLGGSIDLHAGGYFSGRKGLCKGATGCYFSVIAPDRTVIHHPDPALILRPAPPDGTDPLLDRLVGEVYADCCETVNVRGAWELVTLGRMPTTGWVVAVAGPVDTIFAPMRHLREMFILLVAGVLLAGGVIAHLLARRLTGNLELFSTHLQRLPQLPVDKRAFHSKANDETQLVSRAFNRLLLELEAERDELFRAKNRAEAANETKSRFLSNVSHELRTPLHGIIGLTQLCQETEAEGEQQERLAGILGSAKCLLRLINDLLAIQGIEAGRLSLENTAFSLRHLFDNTIKEFAPQAQAKGLDIGLDIPAEIPDMLTGDPARLQQILAPLLDNAVKFSDSGRIILGVGSLSEAADEVRLRFWVRDEGGGIQTERLELIFQPFEQGEQTNTRRFGGVGIGLALCRQMLALLGSSLEVASVPGAGSTFSFVLPFAVQKTPVFLAPVPAVDLQGRTVLIVGRSAAIGRQLTTYLERLQMVPVVVDDPDHPWISLDGGKTDIIFFDASDGVEDPREPIRRLRRYLGADPLLVLISPVGMSEDVDFSQAGRIDGFLQKPLQEAAVAEFIACLLARDGSEGDPPHPPLTQYQVEENRYRLTVLVAEDIEINRRIMSTILLRHGHRVLQAENGRKAVALWRDNAIDLVFMDVQMPEMDGLEATRLIRAVESAAKKARTPIIAVTAGVLPEEKAACLDAGMDGYLLKPFDLIELRVLLVHAIQNKCAGREDPVEKCR
ncbi:MAG: response regulator, partial [Desulfuromonadales bacterium]